MSKVRMDKLAGAIHKLQQQQATRQAYIERLTGGKAQDLTVTEAELYGLGDVLLSIGGPCVFLDALENDTTQDKHNPELAALFTGWGFVKRDEFWACDDLQVVADFITAWLAEADATGREVSNRAVIAQWAKVPSSNR